MRNDIVESLQVPGIKNPATLQSLNQSGVVQGLVYKHLDNELVLLRCHAASFADRSSYAAYHCRVTISKGKRPTDPNQLAKWIVERSTASAEKPEEVQQKVAVPAPSDDAGCTAKRPS
jgi:hypothetical protein